MILCMWIPLFSVFGFLWYCVDVLIYGVLSLSQNVFFKMVYVSGILSPLKFTFPDHFLINVILSRVISLIMLIFFYRFFSGFSEEDALLVKYISCTMCIFLRNTGKHDMCSVVILCDVTFSDHIVHLTCMVHGLQLQY